MEFVKMGQLLFPHIWYVVHILLCDKHSIWLSACTISK